MLSVRQGMGTQIYRKKREDKHNKLTVWEEALLDGENCHRGQLETRQSRQTN